MILWNLDYRHKTISLVSKWIRPFAGMTATIFVLLFIFSKNVSAAGEFSTSYDINYSVIEDGATEVTQEIKLKNLTDRFFPSSFSIVLPGSEISDITASDKQGSLEIQSSQENSNTKVTVNFTNQQIIGLNKEYNWTLKFKDKGVAKKLGSVWSVNLPKISQQAEVESLNLTLSVPTSFSDPDFISPKPSRTTESGGQINLNFTNNELLTSGISAIFGNTLNFEFENSYILKNDSIFPNYQSIVIPGNSAYQKSFVSSINPPPENTTKDELGNTKATFKLNSNQELEVKVKGQISTSLQPLYKDILSTKEVDLYTKETNFWDKNNQLIKNKLLEITDGKNPPNDFEKARLVDKYVSNFLRFDRSRIEKNDFVRFGSVTALNNPEKSLSAEYVDLETALLRTAGIPTRQVIGFALKNGDSKPFSFSNQNLHTWLEFFDPSKGWIIADPTWENTTAGADFFAFNDLNHLALAFSNGERENYVLPTNINVQVLESGVGEQVGANLDIQVADQILSGFPSKAKVRINNIGNTAFPASKLEISTSKILLEFPNTQPETIKIIDTPEIPPFGNLEYTFNLKTGAIWHSYQDAFQVKFTGSTDTRIINVVPILSYKIFAVEIFGALTIIALFYIVVLLIHHKSAKKG